MRQPSSERRIESFCAGGKESFLDEAVAAHEDRPAGGSGLLEAAGEPALYPGDFLAQGKKGFLRRGGRRHDGVLSSYVLVMFRSVLIDSRAPRESQAPGEESIPRRRPSECAR